MSSLIDKQIAEVEARQKLLSQGFSQDEIAELESSGNSLASIVGGIYNPNEGVAKLTQDDLNTSKIDAGIGQAANQQVGKNVVGSESDDIEDIKGSVAAQTQAAKREKLNNFKSGLGSIGQVISGVDFSKNASWRDSGLSEGGAMRMGIASKATTAAVNAIDQATMGDKNFSASSNAIDSAVHGVSGALMSSGNPWAMLAGGALEGLNFLTKAGGQTVQGYDVNIENSGYGTMGHQESESGRIWDRWSGATARKLAKRNAQTRMALQAAEISEDVKFEQEARMNSVDNVLRNNQIALAGGIDTSLLGS